MKTNKNLLLITTILIASMSSCVNYHRVKGNEYYDYTNYAPCIKHLEKVYAKNPNAETELKLADAYFKINKMDAAEAKYARAVDRENVDPTVNIAYGKVLMEQEKNDQAVAQFDKYLQVHPGDVVVKLLVNSCATINERFRDTTLYVLQPIVEKQFVNTFSVIEYKDGAIFSADKKVSTNGKKNPFTGESYLDLYKMNKDDKGNWSEPELLKGDVNGRLHEGSATFSQDGTTMYFTRSNYMKRKMVINDEDENDLKIFKADLIDGEWKKSVAFPYNSDDYSCGHPALSADGKTMFFVSDMPGGLGGTDIYKTTIGPDGIWTTPVNLGSEINTTGNEMFPYVHSDGTLYFSSNAHNSMGGLDVFESTYNGSSWSKPQNLNYPINSEKDDFAFSLNKDNETGYLSSSRTDTDVMYSFVKNPATFKLFASVREKGTSKPLEGVVVEITNEQTGEKINYTSDKDGNFTAPLAIESDYDLLCSKIGCFTETDRLSTKGIKYSQEFYALFEVAEIVIDQPIVIKNIYYDFDKANIRPDAAKELDKLVRVLNNNPKLDIEMGSHTDARGSDDYNLDLSDRRAKSAVEYLIQQGIAASRLTYKGYGETMHVNKCKNGVKCSEADHQANRRTEFKVKKVNQ